MTRKTMLGAAVAVLVVLLQQVAWFVSYRDVGKLLSVLLLTAIELPAVFLVLSPLFSWAKRRDLSFGSLVALGVLVAGVTGIVCGAACWALHAQFPQLNFRTSGVAPNSFSRMLISGFAAGQTYLGLWTLAFVLPRALEDARVRNLEAAKHQAEAGQLRSAAELTRLRSNLEPHFLLNTLNAIAGLVTEDAREARRLLVALGDLLRDALRDQDELETLSAQVAWLKRYAEILEARHRGSLHFTWEIAPESRDVLLPRLLLQPLVENAVKHGALRSSGTGQVAIRSALSEDGGSLVCTVEDNGPGLPAAPVRDGAFGLQSVRRRIALRYGERGSVSLASANGSTQSRVVLPRAAGDAVGAA